ncbi:flagellar assembly protein FliH [Parvibium lacunae]|uniref:Flagellar assembly protein FliH n=1 Tax=Parvibium lacunae TaxID=1888893 RepID=A0A368L412_9BURK|nr:flagellar assembly protein FliH [Parvibium lacunae]RCS58318.1 flagellar assembly protein FliH [Parvibium lacunae]
MADKFNKIISADSGQAVQVWSPKLLHDPAPKPVKQAVRAIDLAELQERALEEARAEGYQQGLQEGYNAGEHWVQQESQRMWNLLTQAEQSLQTLQSNLADSVLDLAIDVAQQILRHALQTDRTVIIPVVREAIDQLVGTGNHPQLFISPQDSELVRREFADELQLDHWKIIEDPRIEPGGCKISTAFGDIDAQVNTRWQRTVAALGKKVAYQAELDIDPPIGGAT